MSRLAFVVLALGAATARAETLWEIDPAHSRIQFSVRQMMVGKVRGEFTKFGSTVRADDQDVTRSVIEATIDAASIDTREPKRDEHLRSPDFLDVARFPTITFKSKRITNTGEGRYAVVGDLTLHGVTKEVTLDVTGPTPPVEGPHGTVRAGARATAKIDRRDFGISWSTLREGGGLFVGNGVEITLEVDGVKK